MTLSRKKRIAFLLVGLLISGSLAFAVGEVLARWYASSPTPMEELVETWIDRYLASPPEGLQYDPLLGWSPVPNGRSGNGMYHSDQHGIRIGALGPSRRAYTKQPKDGVLRIAIYGDSFTAGHEVVFEDTWGFRLEQKLHAAGINAEVLNFGVAGYGMDQALLRWRETGATFAPRVVIFGFYAYDVVRNLNVFRPMLGPTGIPLTKPRFVLDSGELSLVGVPPMRPEELPDLTRNFRESELAQYEYFLPVLGDGGSLRSELVSLVKSRLFNEWQWGKDPPTDKVSFSFDGEAGDLGLMIIRRFADEVEATGADFLVVNLPSKSSVSSKNDPGYRGLLDRVSEESVVVDVLQDLRTAVDITSLDPLFMPENHYSGAGNEIVAKTLADFLISERVEATR